MKTLIDIYREELEQEALTTRKMLERVPTEQFGWKPHEKSMDIKMLATHIAELPTWVTMTIKTDGLDFAANAYNPTDVKNTEELMQHFESSLKDGLSELTPDKLEHLEEVWTLRNGEEIYSASPKYAFIRTTLSQIVHHRAQLGVYLRLLNIPIPGSYGPSADETNF